MSVNFDNCTIFKIAIQQLTFLHESDYSFLSCAFPSLKCSAALGPPPAVKTKRQSIVAVKRIKDLILIIIFTLNAKDKT
jgi:hypothetical protein